MQFIVSSNALSKHLAAVSGVLNQSTTLPILSNVLFEVADGKLKLSGSDLETTIQSTMALVKASDDIKVCVPFKLLSEVLKTFGDQPLTFSVDPKSFAIEVLSDTGKYKLAGSDGDEYPRTPEIKQSTKVNMDSGALFGAITKTLFATGNDELRPVMSGVYFNLEKDGMTFVSTDSHKLVRYKRHDSKASKAASFIMPKKALSLIKGLLSSLTTDVVIEYNDVNASFEFENFTLVCRLVDGKYPNYESVIPKENPNKLTISRAQFLNSVKRVSIFANKTTQQVRLEIKGSEVQIFAEDLDYNNEAHERIGCQFTGDDMVIAFNSRFLIEMLANLESDEVLLEMSAPNRAGLLSPIEKSEDESILMLVMPVMINA